jgi:hypothetical protein
MSDMAQARRGPVLPALLVLGLAGCATIGRDFNATQTGWIRAGETDKTTLLSKLGDPFRVGVDAGDPTWTYGYYRYSLFGESVTKDLVIRFDDAGKVKSFTLNTSFPEEKTVLEPVLKK